MKKSVFRSVVFIALAIVFAASCIACGGSDKPAPAKEQKSAEEIYQDVLAVSGFGNMTPVPKRDYVEIYGVDTNKFFEDDYVWYVSDNPSLNADEVAVFHVEKEGYAEVLKGILQMHINTRLNVAESYSPEEAGKLRQAEIVVAETSNGAWVYFCVGSQYSEMMRVLGNEIG